MEQKKRMEITILSTFFCVCVVLIHLTSVPVTQLQKGSLAFFLFFAFNKLLSFVVPGFVFLSGYKLTLAYQTKRFCFFPFILQRLIKIGLPYAFWYSIFYLYFRKIGYVEYKTVMQHVSSFLLGDLAAPFYFITIIFQCYLLFGLLLQLFRSFSPCLLLLFGIGMQWASIHFLQFPFQDRAVTTYMAYFCIGIYAAFYNDHWEKELHRHKRILLLLFIVCAAYYVYKSYLATAYGIPFSWYLDIELLFRFTSLCVWFLIALWLAPKLPETIKKLVIAIDQGSFYIYLSHCIAIYIGGRLWTSWGQTSVIRGFIFTSLFLFATVFPLSYLYTRFLKRKRRKEL